MTCARAIRRVRHGLIVAGCLAALAASAQERDTLETKVSVNGRELTFKWSKKHPWDAELIARGASLYAEYRNLKQIVGTECVQPAAASDTTASIRGTARGRCFVGNVVFRQEERAIHFQLPESLTSEAAGPVCLVLRMPDNRVIPIRQATRQGAETARFQVVEWGHAANARTRVRHLEQRRQDIEQTLAAQSREVAEQERANASRHWHSADACRAIAATPLSIVASDRPAAVPEQQDDVARQLCTIRVANGRADSGDVSSPDDLDTLLARVPEDSRTRWYALRGEQVRQFTADWERYRDRRASFVAQYPVPHFGAYKERLRIQTFAHLAYRLSKPGNQLTPAAETTLLLGYLGSKVEAYERCVSDGKRQLDLNYREALRLKATLATMPDRLRDQEIKSCQASLERLSTMRARAAAFQDELNGIRREIASSNASVGSPPRRRELNEVVCLP